MAITPRTILTSAAPATVAVVSLYFFTVLGTTAFKCLSDKNETQTLPPVEVSASPASDVCNHVAQRFGEEQRAWSEFAWIQYTYCYDQHDDSLGAIAAADEGLKHFPRSEVLYNMKGYHEIAIGEHSRAIDTLRTGLNEVAYQRNGVMTNNLAWAGLWEPRQMRLDEARTLYNRSLASSPGVCETMHTGLFVEFAIAGQSHGLERFDALKRFSELRNSYDRCLSRLHTGEWLTVVEIVGAAVVFDHLDTANNDVVSPLLREATATLERNFPDVTAEHVCSEAIPMADFHHVCVDAVNAGFEANRMANLRERNERARTNRQIIEQYGHDYPVIREKRTRCLR